MGVMLVTGASAGIGRAVAARALDQGWQVALLARRAGPMDEIAAARDTALVLPCDVGDSAQVNAAFAATVARFGRVDVLFNNAGWFPPSATPDAITDADWDRAVAVNLSGMFYCARAAFAQMRAQDPQGGRIINNGSVSAQVPRLNALAYSTTKHAINGLTKSLALDGRPFGIAAGQIDIGNARTELAARIETGSLQADGSLRPEPMMGLEPVVDAVLAMAAMPPGANVLQMTVMASAMPLVGRG